MKVLYKQSKEKQLEYLKTHSVLGAVLAYLPLVTAVAKHYPDKEGVFEAGVEGLAKARKLYLEKEDRGYKFSTYATYFIKDAIEGL